MLHGWENCTTQKELSKQHLDADFIKNLQGQILFTWNSWEPQMKLMWFSCAKLTWISSEGTNLMWTLSQICLIQMKIRKNCVKIMWNDFVSVGL